ncbi:MAG: DMT family transporter [Parabacteroides sp.]
MFVGEMISLGVAVSWTATALCFEYAGKRIGTLSLNVVRLSLSLLMLGITLWITTGEPLPLDANGEAWLWLGVSGFIGYVLGDYCLFNSYLYIGSRFGQLFMTLAPPSAALTGWLILGEQLPPQAWFGMFVTLSGIALSIISKSGGSSDKWHVTLPWKGVLFGIGAGTGQGVGLVFSKLGMNYFMQTVDASDATALFMVPFAATEIRAIIGVIGFVVLLFASRQGRLLRRAVHDRKAMSAATAGTIFGPYLGVSFSLMAVQYTEAGIASTLMALTPILILLPSYLLYRQRVTFRELLGALISVFGVSLFFL